MIKKRFERPLHRQDSNAISWSSSFYWDFAAARRELWDTWVTKESPTCWHRQTLKLLEFVQKRAYGEIRAKVMLTIGTKLPPELTESVFERAMLAEEAPLHM